MESSCIGIAHTVHEDVCYVIGQLGDSEMLRADCSLHVWSTFYVDDGINGEYLLMH